MTREEFDKLYLGKAIHCDTKEKADEFLALADSVGYSWANYKALVGNNQWMTHKSNTCYRLTKCGFWYGEIDFYKSEGIEIIEYQPQPQPKFKLGDKVRIKSTFYFDGKVGVIVEFNSPSPIPYGVKFDDDVSLWFLSENQLEKVEEPKFKEGDKVRIKDPSSTYTNGKVGVIIEKNNSLERTRYLVEINDGDYHGIWYYCENELEKVEETKLKEETVNKIIEEIKENQKRITALLNRLEQEVKNK